MLDRLFQVGIVKLMFLESSILREGQKFGNVVINLRYHFRPLFDGFEVRFERAQIKS